VSPTLTITLLWLAFGVSHIVLSSVDLRKRLVGILGEQGFMGMYSLVALGCFVPMVMVYFSNKHVGGPLWSVPMTEPLRWLIYIGMGVAFVLLVAGMLTPSPASLSAAKGAGPVEPKGVQLITRHAVFMGVAIFGLVHLIPNGYATDIAFFAGFPIFVLIGSIHQDKRKLITEPDRYGPFHAATPLIPFTGAHTLRGLKELSKLALVIGIGLTVLTRVFHIAWFG
jgi:uncharacterized membrane protein